MTSGASLTAGRSGRNLPGVRPVAPLAAHGATDTAVAKPRLGHRAI